MVLSWLLDWRVTFLDGIQISRIHHIPLVLPKVGDCLVRGKAVGVFQSSEACTCRHSRSSRLIDVCKGRCSYAWASREDGLFGALLLTVDELIAAIIFDGTRLDFAEFGRGMQLFTISVLEMVISLFSLRVFDIWLCLMFSARWSGFHLDNLLLIGNCFLFTIEWVYSVSIRVKGVK